VAQTESSRRWLKRQQADLFVKQARTEGYRCRAVYKLLEIETRYKILQKVRTVVDLGAAPGGWSQMLARKYTGQSQPPSLIAVDKLPMQEIPGVTFLQGDFEEESTLHFLKDLLHEKSVDVVLSDMALNATGHAKTDHLRNMALVESAYNFAAQYLVHNGRFVAKVFQGGTENHLLTTIKQDFEKVIHVKPKASRPESREVYVVATGFRKNAFHDLSFAFSSLVANKLTNIGELEIRGKKETMSTATQKRTVAVALSGGVDSSTCAALMKAAGHNVIAITLDLFPLKEDKADSTQRAAQRTADFLDIPHHFCDVQTLFRQRVIQPFIESYCRGETPLPCALCNQHVKFGALVAFAKKLGADTVVTGHYARKQEMASGEVRLLRASDTKKDQSYFLFGVNRDILSSLLFPLGELTKNTVRTIARILGLPSHNRAESQDICFVGNRHYTDIVHEYLAEEERPLPGDIIDKDGNRIGRHRGVLHYTVGQRKGLHVTLGYPAYVTAIDKESNAIVVGQKKDLVCSSVVVRDLNWISLPRTPTFEALAKVRSTQAAVPALVEVSTSTMRVTFQRPEYGVAPGQACVLYNEDVLLGGGWIVSEERKALS
jgi:tRNA-specific 2-thiouridylase